MKRLLLLILAITVLAIVGCRLEADPTDVQVKLRWTATGDDYAVGTATYYDIRYTGDSTNNWSVWTEIPQSMTPKLSGQPESITFGLTLESGTEYYFCLKAADEAYNWSGRSNLAPKIWADTTAPMAVTDLGVE